MNKYFVAREKCPACKSSNKELLLKLRYDEPPVREYLTSWYSYKSIDSEYLDGSNYTLNECKECGLIYQEEILNDSTVVKLYDEWIDYEKVAERIKKTLSISFFYNHARDLANVVSFTGIVPGNFKALDFGMGFGTWCHLAKGLGCDAYGTEISQEKINYAEGVKVIPWPKLRDWELDFINTEQVFEHLSDPFETLIYLKQSLKPGGIIKINVPEGWNVKTSLGTWDWEGLKVCNSQEKLELIKKIWDWESPKGSGNKNSLNAVAPLQHINCFNREVLIKMAEKAGLIQVNIPDSCNTASAKGMNERIKAFIRPCYSVLFRRGKTIKRGTKLFFKRAD